MFSSEIVSSDAFLEMPTSSRELYFQLGMYADDDGFVNPKKIMRMCGASDDDLKVLLAKRFLLPFESGVVVIKHWLIHNMIRKDRYKETMYLEEKKTLNIKENRAYSDTAVIGQPNDNQRLPQDRIGEVRRVEERPYASLSFLGKMPSKDLLELSEKYRILPRGIQAKATDLKLYCEAKGKKYKNYRAFLENALRKDGVKLRNEYPLPRVEPKEEAGAPIDPKRWEQLKKEKGDVVKKLSTHSSVQRPLTE